MNETIRWWLVMQLIALPLLPLCLGLFRRLPDRGYALSKPFGLLFLGYTFWLLNSAHILPNSGRGIVFALLLLIAISAAFAYPRREELQAWARDNWPYVVGVEVVLLLVFVMAVWLRSMVGNISGTEQPMDLMFVNAATQTDHFPPKDPWLSGHTVAYYYFGYLIVAMLGQLAAVATDVAYNIGLAMIPALALVGAGGLVYNLVRMREDAGSPVTTAVSAARPVRGRRDGVRRRQAAIQTHYGTLGVPATASAEEIAEAYARKSRPDRPDLDRRAAVAEAQLREVETAYAVLSDPAARRRYDEETNGIATGAVAAPAADGAPRMERATGPRTRAAAIPAPAVSATPAAAYNWRPVVFGLAGGLMLVAMGNLAFVLHFISAYGLGSTGFYDKLHILGLDADELRHSWYPSRFFAFFDVTRIYQLNGSDWVITEFPMFSFVLGDLHPHVMALPFVLLTVGAALTLYRSPEPLDIAFWIQRPLALLAAAIVLGSLAFINTWDIATLTFVVLAAAFVSNYLRVRALTADLFVQAVSFALPLVVLAIIAYIPFYGSFQSQADGIAAVVSNRGVTVPATPPLKAFLFWGPLFIVVLPFAIARILAARERVTPRAIVIVFVPFLAIVVGWALLFGVERAADSSHLEGAGGFGTQISDRGSAWLTDIVLGAMLAAALLALWLEVTGDDDRDEREGVIFALLLTSTAMLLILGTEFFYVGDVFNSRMNTVFKLYYQAWVMLAVAGGFALYYLASRWRSSFPREMSFRAAWAAAAALVLAGAALYPLGGAFNRLKPYTPDGRPQDPNGSLHGLAYFPADERAAISFLQNLAPGQNFVIAEAVTGDYREGARISEATGLPAIVGWAGHEDQWRGGTMKARAGRVEDIETLYRSTDAQQMAQILRKYGVTYVYVGDLERNTYGAAGLAKFESMPVAFQRGAVTIYRATKVTGEVQSP